jgi:hypothetical protein
MNLILYQTILSQQFFQGVEKEPVIVASTSKAPHTEGIASLGGDLLRNVAAIGILLSSLLPAVKL